MNTADAVNSQKRPYHPPQCAAAAARTRGAVMAAAKDVFEHLGWSGATMRAVADRAGVSVKTVEVLYRTKAELLKATVDYAIAGDVEPIPMLAREPVAAMEAAPDAAAMLGLHAGHVRAGHRRARGRDGRHPPGGRRLGRGHPAGQTRPAAARHPGLRRGGLLAGHRPRHLPQPDPRPRPQPGRLRDLDRELLRQDAPCLTGVGGGVTR